MYILCSTFLLPNRHLDHRAVDFFSRIDQMLSQTSNDVLAFRDTTSSVGAPVSLFLYWDREGCQVSPQNRNLRLQKSRRCFT